MAWSPTDEICLELPPIPSIDDICLPGGFCLSHVWNGIDQIPHLADVPLQFFGQIGPALAPLAPVFDIIDFALAIFKCVQGTIDAITELNPVKIIECIPDLAKYIDKLLALIPQLSVPRMVKKAIEAMALLLRALASDFEYVKTTIQRIIDLIDRAADLNDVNLNSILACAQKTVTDQSLSTAEALKGIGRIILLLNIFIGLIGGEPIPCFGTLIEDNITDGLDVIIATLTALAEVLETLAALIPDPILELTLALGAERC